VIAFTQICRISGQVDGNVRSFTNTIIVSGNVAKNMTSFSESITVDGTGKVGGSMTTFVNSLAVDGHVGRDILAFVNNAVVAGTIEGGMRVTGNKMRFNSSARVLGPVKFKGENPPDVDSGAKLEVPIEFTREQHHEDFKGSGFYVWRVIWTAAIVLFGLVLFLIMPAFARESVDSAQHYGASFGLGALVLFAVPIAALIACVTVVGLPIGISTFVLWMAALNCAQLVVGAIIGQWLMGQTSETWQLIGRMVVGVILVRVATMIPHLGGWIKFAVILWGLGAISLAIYRRIAPSTRGNVPVVPSTPSPLPPNTFIGTPQSV
jgi:hypothetical protein